MITEKLKTLHNNFVVFPIVKVCGNFSFVFQRYFAQVLINELGLHIINSTKSSYM